MAHETPEGDRINDELAKLEAVMPVACREYEAQCEAVETSWHAEEHDGGVRLSITKTVVVCGTDARDALNEAHIELRGANLIASNALDLIGWRKANQRVMETTN